MPSSFTKLTLPLFPDWADANDAFNDEECRIAGAFISTDGQQYFLHGEDDLALALHGVANVRIGSVLGRPLPTLSIMELATAGIDPLAPSMHLGAGASPSLGAGMAVASVFSTPRGQAYATTFVDLNGPLSVIIKLRSKCTARGEKRREPPGGLCPDHVNGRLVPI